LFKYKEAKKLPGLITYVWLGELPELCCNGNFKKKYFEDILFNLQLAMPAVHWEQHKCQLHGEKPNRKGQRFNAWSLSGS
jgi:hypothetical protein